MVLYTLLLFFNALILLLVFVNFENNFSFNKGCDWWINVDFIVVNFLFFWSNCLILLLELVLIEFELNTPFDVDAEELIWLIFVLLFLKLSLFVFIVLFVFKLLFKCSLDVDFDLLFEFDWLLFILFLLLYEWECELFTIELREYLSL